MFPQRVLLLLTVMLIAPRVWAAGPEVQNTAPSTAQEPERASGASQTRVDLHVNPGLIVFAAPGLGLGARVGPREARWMVGASFQAGRLPSASREAFFDATFDLADAEVDWDLAVSLDVFVNLYEREHLELVASVGYGYETWDVRLGDDTTGVHNAYVNGFLGARVIGGHRAPVFAEAGLTGIVLFGQRNNYPLGDETIELARAAWNPAIRVGYRFQQGPE